jgi:equilibrative nucleoside transporter 1/2/3
VLLGVGVLLPWNIFISAPDYFSMLYGPTVEFYFSIAYSYPNLLGLVLMLRIGHYLSFTQKMIPFFIVFILILIMVPILPLLMASDASLGLTMAFVVVTGIGSAVTQGGAFGFAGVLPSDFMQALMAGNGVSGVFICLLRIITKLTMPATDRGIRDATMIYFFLGAAVIGAALFSTLIVLRVPFIKQYMGKSGDASGDTAQEYSSLVGKEQSSSMSDKSSGQDDAQKPSMLSVLKQTLRYNFSVWMVFFVTIMLFPGLTAQIESTSGMGDWYPIILITTFNVFDTIGRSTANRFRLFSHRTLPIAVIARLVFIPLFVLCLKPHVFTHDSIPIIIMVVFSLSNGYMGSLAMMMGPDCVGDHEKQVAGTMLTFFLLLGIATGAAAGLGLHVAITPS